MFEFRKMSRPEQWNRRYTLLITIYHTFLCGWVLNCFLHFSFLLTSILLCIFIFSEKANINSTQPTKIENRKKYSKVLNLLLRLLISKTIKKRYKNNFCILLFGIIRIKKRSKTPTHENKNKKINNLSPYHTKK